MKDVSERTAARELIALWRLPRWRSPSVCHRLSLGGTSVLLGLSHIQAWMWR